MPKIDLTAMRAAKSAAGTIKAMKGAGWSWHEASAPTAPIYGRGISFDLRWTTAIPSNYALGIVPRGYWTMIGAGGFAKTTNLRDSTGATTTAYTEGSGSIVNSGAGVGLMDGSYEANMFALCFTLPANFRFAVHGIPYAKYDLYAYISALNAQVQVENFTFAGQTIAYSAACPGWTGSYIEGNGGNTLSRKGLSGSSQTLATSLGSSLVIGGFQIIERLD